MTRMCRQMRIRTAMRTLIWVAVTVLISACGEPAAEEQICQLDEVQACPCIGGGQAVQECAEDRQGWGQCQCGSGEDLGEDSGMADSGMADSSIADSGIADSSIADSGIADSGVADSGVADIGAADIGGPDGEVVAGRLVTLWAHRFEGTLGPGTGLQPGDMETQGGQGFSDDGSWVSMGGWLSKTLSTVGYNTIEVEYFLTKAVASTCELNVTIDGGSTWTNVLSDRGDGQYTLNATLPASAEGERRVELRWVAVNDWCWMNDIRITALETGGR